MYLYISEILFNLQATSLNALDSLMDSEVRSCSGKNKIFQRHGKGREFCLKSGKISLEGKVGLGTCESKIKAPLR